MRVADAIPALREAIEREAEAVRTRYTDAAAIRALPEVQAFQEVLRRVGAKSIAAIRVGEGRRVDVCLELILFSLRR